jgi:hypothetical protein
MILAIDFDGVIHNNPTKGMGNPIEGAKESLHKLYWDNRIIIHSVRATTEDGKRMIESWMNEKEIPYHEVTSTKPQADVYLDDKAIRFTRWDESMISIQNVK